jgi:hypothetical protein
MHERYSLKCPGSFLVDDTDPPNRYGLQVVEFSDDGFLAHSRTKLPLHVWGQASVQLGSEEKSNVKAMVVRGKHGFYGFKLAEADISWRKLVSVLKSGITSDDLDHASRFLAD